MSNSKVEFRHGVHSLEVPVVSGALDIYVGDNINYDANGFGKAASDTEGEVYAGVAMEELYVSATDNTEAGKYAIKVLPANGGNIVRRKLAATRATALPGTSVFVAEGKAVKTSGKVNGGKIAAYVSDTEVDVAI